MVVALRRIVSKPNHVRTSVIVTCHVVNLLHCSTTGVLGTDSPASTHIRWQVGPHQKYCSPAHCKSIASPFNREALAHGRHPAQQQPSSPGHEVCAPPTYICYPSFQASLQRRTPETGLQIQSFQCPMTITVSWPTIHVRPLPALCMPCHSMCPQFRHRILAWVLHT